jgi:hypothetical protein
MIKFNTFSNYGFVWGALFIIFNVLQMPGVMLKLSKTDFIRQDVIKNSLPSCIITSCIKMHCVGSGVMTYSSGVFNYVVF